VRRSCSSAAAEEEAGLATAGTATPAVPGEGRLEGHQAVAAATAMDEPVGKVRSTVPPAIPEVVVAVARC